MDKYEITGGKSLRGEIGLSGAKNVAMKTIVAALLTDSKVTVRNVPLISSVTGTAEIVNPLNVKVNFLKNNSVTIETKDINNHEIPLELGGLFRTSTMTIGPLLHRFGKAIVPNPGGCRLGKRPIDRHIEGLKALGAKIYYRDGYFYASSSKLRGTHFTFEKNTHTGTETMILAATRALGKTILENASQEPEVDDLIRFLNSMGAKIKRTNGRTITIEGVKDLHGTDYKIMSDRNEAVTFAIAAYVTKGDILVKDIDKDSLQCFLEKLKNCEAKYEILKEGIRFFNHSQYKSTDVITYPFPGFMTDWQAPWALFATQAEGVSTVHETVFEGRFGYVSELKKMGAKIDFFDPIVKDPKKFYNFNWNDRDPNYHQGIRITGPVKLHNAVVEVSDLRAGATLVLAALAAKGKSVIFGIEHIDRGYEAFEVRLNKLGANIKRLKEDL